MSKTMTHDTDDTATVQLPENVMANHALMIALESNLTEWDILVHSRYGGDVDWSLPDTYDEDMDVEVIEADAGTAILVHGTIDGTEARKVSHARLNPPGKAHPAEYETYVVPIAFTVEWYPAKYNAEGETFVRVERL